MQLERASRVFLAAYCSFLGLLKFVNGYSDAYALPWEAFYVIAVLECAIAVILLTATRARATLLLPLVFFACGMLFSLFHDGDCG